MSKILLCVLTVSALFLNGVATAKMPRGVINPRQRQDLAQRPANAEKIFSHMMPLATSMRIQPNASLIATAKSQGPEYSIQAANPDSIGPTWWDQEATFAIPNMCVNMAGGIGAMVATAATTSTLSNLGCYYGACQDLSKGWQAVRSGGLTGFNAWKNIQTAPTAFSAMAMYSGDFSEVVVS